MHPLSGAANDLCFLNKHVHLEGEKHNLQQIYHTKNNTPLKNQYNHIKIKIIHTRLKT